MGVVDETVGYPESSSARVATLAQRNRVLAHAAALAVVVAAWISVAAAQQPASAPSGSPSPQQRAAMLQQWMKASQAQLRAYEWVETTVVAKGGEEKSRKQNRCYYGADGKLQKIPIEAAGSQDSGREARLGKRLKEKKKEEITSYMQSAVQLVHSYVPPDPARIQQSINSGKLSANVLEPGRRVQLDFKDYLKAGDVLSAQIEMPTNRLLGVGVSSYLDSPDDPVRLDVGMGVLPDGTIYSAKTVLDAKAKGLTVTVENAGYRKAATMKSCFERESNGGKLDDGQTDRRSIAVALLACGDCAWRRECCHGCRRWCGGRCDAIQSRSRSKSPTSCSPTWRHSWLRMPGFEVRLVGSYDADAGIRAEDRVQRNPPDRDRTTRQAAHGADQERRRPGPRRVRRQDPVRLQR